MGVGLCCVVEVQVKVKGEELWWRTAPALATERVEGPGNAWGLVECIAIEGQFDLP